MKYRYRVLALLSSLSVITYLDRVCISVAGKAIQTELGLNLQQWGWILGAFVVAYGLFEIPSGMLGDRIGSRRVLTRIVLWWSAFTALTGVMHGFWSLLVTRSLFGAGEAGAFPNSSGTIARWFPVKERAGAQGVVWMASRLGGALAPVIMVPLLTAYGWRLTFGTLGLIGVGWVVVWHWWFRDRPAEKKGVSFTELAEIGAPENPNKLSSFTWRIALRQPNLWWIMLMYHANAWCGFFFLTWLYTFLQNGRGFTAHDLVSYSWLPFVFGAAANLAGGWTSDFLVPRIGLKMSRRMVGCSAYALTAVLLAATIYTEDKRLTVLWLALAYGCSDFAIPTAWAVCLDVGRQHVGAVTGAMNMAGQAGSFLTTVLFGYLVGAYGTYNAPLVPIAIASIIGSLAWLKIDASKPLIADPP